MKSVQCFAKFFEKSRWRIFFILYRKRLLPLSRKIQAKTHLLSCFFARRYLDSIREHTELFSRWKAFFYYLKGRGPLKEVKKIAEM